ncbi:peptidylprolyl isomerase [Paenibacillus crassostreae]|uniref:Peptidyl-prolyl cis-trans isomerase n=1 Tax=Paenibacillus crassostreae TaxID=1763538 RepID=A0A162N7A8_9BACL|nr:peptidylprolyl isomerase [Paenibacillus crassostreae]AOZ92377.1 peptidylprolyl isomerase [Paenibacillus crassostreae]OAB71092.1 peptidylprolyl isomerase [Paenibacillus crassostreae]
MNKKNVIMPLATMMLAVLLLAGCGNNNAKSGDTTTSQPTEQAPAEQATTLSWDNPPAMEIDITKSYEAEMTTSKGTFTIELFAKDAPITVNNFVFLAKQGFYDDVIFHRIIESFMIQTGDPEGSGRGGPGYKFEDEKTTYQYEPGIVAMANAGSNTNGSQFFICTGADSASLNSQPNYTIFGKVTNGMDVVQAIAATPVEVGASGEMSSPTETVQIKEIKITEK